ncbi:MAG TPA: VOC family protein [Bauldia sp.]
MREEHTIVTGIHHCTICVGAAQEDIDFMTRVIGQRMIKQTVLFDGTAPIYHLYYANKNAEIGTVMTCFPFKQAAVFGRKGSGQIGAVAYSISENALDFWVKHLDKHKVKHSGILKRFDRNYIRFAEPSGNVYELIGDDRDKRAGWTTDEISEANSVKGFNAIIMSVREVEGQDAYFTVGLGFTKTGQEGKYHRYDILDGGPCKTVILEHNPDQPAGTWTFGAGTPHHVAFAVANDDLQMKLKLYLEGLGYTDASESKDRQYFHSVYVRSPAGILTEFATTDIGFAVDEPMNELGTHLLLPPWFEDRRAEIIAPLEKITVPASNRPKVHA